MKKCPKYQKVAERKGFSLAFAPDTVLYYLSQYGVAEAWFQLGMKIIEKDKTEPQAVAYFEAARRCGHKKAEELMCVFPPPPEEMVQQLFNANHTRVTKIIINHRELYYIRYWMTQVNSVHCLEYDLRHHLFVR